MNDVLFRDIVSCRLAKGDKDSPPSMFEAPAYSGLAKGDLVVVDTGAETMRAKVLGVQTVAYDSPHIVLGRVLKTIVYAPFDWKSIDEERKEIGIHA